MATNISANSADLSWNTLGSTATWDIEWGVKGFLLGNGVMINNISTNHYTLTNLFPTTSFDFYVRSNCEGETAEWAGPFTFTTLCPTISPINLPFIENFEHISNLTLDATAQICAEHSGWNYETTGGRARFGTIAPINNGGTGALLLDGNYSNSVNNAILTLDMSNHNALTNLFLSFDFYDVNDFQQHNDSI